MTWQNILRLKPTNKKPCGKQCKPTCPACKDKKRKGSKRRGPFTA